jgi:hypothetical protein
MRPSAMAHAPQQHAQRRCPHPTCTERVPGLLWACLEHWRMLPPQIRKELLRQYRRPGPATLLLRFAQENAFIYWDGLERAA